MGRLFRITSAKQSGAPFEHWYLHVQSESFELCEGMQKSVIHREFSGELILHVFTSEAEFASEPEI